MKMKRRVTSLVKFVLLAIFVISITVFTFKLVRPLTRNVVHPNPEFQAFKEPQPPPEYKVGELIDWHDYAKIKKDLRRKGPGEQGKPFLLSSEEKDASEALFKENGFNALASDQISLHRSIPDIRNPGCKNKKYNSYLPEVSVIVPFFNEHWTTLLRTVYSVLDRSPPQLLKEIILVDDCSTKDFLKEKLDDYVREYLPKVQVVHLPERQGLILARLAGAKLALGDVLLFLDSHCEANVNWLPPLLEPIAEDYRTCVCPFIDVVAHDTFEYRAQDEGARGAFDWELFYKRLPLLPEDLKNPTEPFKSPIMAGGLFAITAQFFWELGGYDDGLQIWGGEQYELSFKIWQCYGRMLDAPCSRVGHIYRKYSPFPNPGRGDFVGKNYRRVAEVWMDDYKEYLYDRRPHYRKIDPGDLTQQKALREKLKCKPFSWFMKEIAFDLTKKYPPVEPTDFASGEIQSVADPSLCVDTMKYGSSKRFGVSHCVSDKKNTENKESAEQSFRLSWTKDVRPKGRSMCWDVYDSRDKAEVSLFGCHSQGGNQFWRYKPDEMWLVHGGNPRCLEVNTDTKEIYVTKCDKYKKAQQWKIEHVHLDRLEDFDKEIDNFD